MQLAQEHKQQKQAPINVTDRYHKLMELQIQSEEFSKYNAYDSKHGTVIDWYDVKPQYIKNIEQLTHKQIKDKIVQKNGSVTIIAKQRRSVPIISLFQKEKQSGLKISQKSIYKWLYQLSMQCIHDEIYNPILEYAMLDTRTGNAYFDLPAYFLDDFIQQKLQLQQEIQQIYSQQDEEQQQSIKQLLYILWLMSHRIDIIPNNIFTQLPGNTTQSSNNGQNQANGQNGQQQQQQNGQNGQVTNDSIKYQCDECTQTSNQQYCVCCKVVHMCIKGMIDAKIQRNDIHGGILGQQFKKGIECIGKYTQIRHCIHECKILQLLNQENVQQCLEKVKLINEDDQWNKQVDMLLFNRYYRFLLTITSLVSKNIKFSSTLMMAWHYLGIPKLNLLVIQENMPKIDKKLQELLTGFYSSTDTQIQSIARKIQVMTINIKYECKKEHTQTLHVRDAEDKEWILGLVEEDDEHQEVMYNILKQQLESQEDAPAEAIMEIVRSHPPKW